MDEIKSEILNDIIPEENKEQANAPTDSKFLCRNLSFAGLENYKLLRTNLSFTIPEEETCPVIGITSTNRDEGKSTTAINLAYVMSEDNKRVLLIDGDLRIPTVAKKLKMRSKPGLTDLLSYRGKKELRVYKTNENDNFFILPSGELPPNPSELLGSRAMGKALAVLKENFDIIIIDLPPAGIVTDALAVSKFLTGLVLVVRQEYTKKKDIDRVIEQIRFANINLLGFVTTAGRNTKGRYKLYKRKGYYKKTYGYSEYRDIPVKK